MFTITIVLALIFFGITHEFEINPISFASTVVDDERVWLVEFYSAMCGGCQEFEPTWIRLETYLTSIATGRINIDDKLGMKLAAKLGVLDDGVPHVRLFTKRNDIKGLSLIKGGLAYLTNLFYITN